jgi:hypothetical protein
MQHRVVRHWWNGQWGRLGRRDVYIRSDNGRVFEVEVRQGGAEGRAWLALFDTLDDAEAEADKHLHHEQDTWRDVSDAHTHWGATMRQPNARPGEGAGASPI